MGSGKTAMQDTIGQASALTGGYGGTYATSAANQAYNAFIEDAYNNLPQYYQMAMEAYQMEGDDLYRQLDMLVGADEREYSRNVTAFDATYQHRNQMYNEAYTQYRDNKSDAFNMANLQLSENAQLVNNAYNLYNATSNYADTLYEREYNKWADEVNQAMQYAGMLNSDWWNQTNYDRDVFESDRTYEQTEKWNQADDDYRYAALKQADEHHNDDMGYKWSSLNEEKRQYNLSHGDTNGDGVLSADELAAYNARSESSNGGDDSLNAIISAEEMKKASNSKAVQTFKASILTKNEFTRRGKSTTIDGNQRRFDSYEDYVEAVIESKYKNGKGTLTENETAYLLAYYGIGE
jgi:hypothetical protein